MLTLTKPTEAEVVAYLIKQTRAPFWFGEVGATRGAAPPRYDADSHRVYLGQGGDVYQRAKQAIRSWRMFPDSMARLYWPDRPISESAVVAVQFRVGCCWSLNPCRIVYTIDSVDRPSGGGPIHRFGFAYGTLADHLERGEERFRVEWQTADDSVWYEIYVISRPGHWLTYPGYPIVRWQQRRFRRLSGQAMQRAVDCSGEEVGASCSTV